MIRTALCKDVAEANYLQTELFSDFSLANKIQITKFIDDKTWSVNTSFE